ncbi:hypothetical protein OO013_18130 [Mangrovivirga sp. M17]|uniref:DUF4905 domain-containing protein n=1 Tax=Mangrovivirga halotolerans TaxID=2993936 RepID=A0ABT3RX73_9BACT|nr:hypothetical protein [Mangrovivirga halotolerans]MCX2745807.1 hypothetical protein [Mangrovivirga halotolerans]
MKQAPKSTFSYTFKFPVWQTVVSSDGKSLGIEARGEGLDDVEFFQYNILTEKIYPIEVKIPDKWWLRLMFLSDEYFIFHEYKGEGNPEVSRSLIVGKDGEIIDEFENMIYFGTDSGKDKFLFTESGNEEDSILYDPKTRKLTKERSAEEITESNYEIQFPAQYHQGTEYFDDVNEFLETKDIKSSIGAVEYLETESLILISGYNKIGKLFSHKLFIFDEEGNLLKEILLESAGKGLTKEPYFIMNGKLFVIEDKNTISTYEV